MFFRFITWSPIPRYKRFLRRHPVLAWTLFVFNVTNTAVCVAKIDK